MSEKFQKKKKIFSHKRKTKSFFHVWNQMSVFTFVIDFFSVTVRQSLDLFLKLLLFSLGLFLQVGFIRTHRQGQSVCVLLHRPGLGFALNPGIYTGNTQTHVYKDNLI